MDKGFLRADSQNNSVATANNNAPSNPEQLIEHFTLLSDRFSRLFQHATNGSVPHDEFCHVTTKVSHMANGLRGLDVDFDGSVLTFVVRKVERMLSEICSIDAAHEHSSAMIALGEDLLDLHLHACHQVAKLSVEQTMS